MKKFIIAGITVATLVTASVAPAFASTTSHSGTSTAITTNGLRIIW